MSRGLKRALALFLCLCALIPAAYAEGTEDLLGEFVLHHGDRNVNKIAITVDDCYQSATEWIARDVELCNEYGMKPEEIEFKSPDSHPFIGGVK